MTTTTRHRDTGIDAVRGVAIWMVVLAHIALWFYPDAAVRDLLSLPGQMIAMPVFFFLSARMRRDTTPRAFVRRAARFALITVVGTTLLDMARQIPLSQVLKPENSFFWFFVALIVFEAAGTVLTALVGRIKGERKRLATVIALIALMQVIFGAAYRMMPEMPVVPVFDLRNMWPCYALGVLCALYPALLVRLRSTPVFLTATVAFTACFILTEGIGDRYFLAGAVAASVICCRIAVWMQSARFIAVIGQEAMWVYILHPFLLILIYHIINQYLTLTLHPLVICAVCAAGAAVLSPAIALPVRCFAVWRKNRKFAPL